MEGNFAGIIEQSADLSVQSKPKRSDVQNIWIVSHLARAGLYTTPWWSPSRDVELRNFWKTSDHLSGALYTMGSKMTAIPFKVIPKSPITRDIIEEADMVTDLLNYVPEFGAGWVAFYSKFVEDLLSQDNGAFAEIIGEGDKNGPIIGQPVSLAHLDAGRCTRTGNAKYPVIYEDLDGKRYALHFSRVIMASQMPSPAAEMLDVGFCAISRAMNVAQTLIDILVFKQEKLGSRPHRQILITQGGLDPNDISSAFQIAEGQLDQMGLSRYSKVVVGGSSSLPEADLKVIELSSMPDGFDEQTSITLGMATIALAFGVDARELFPAMSAGATRADALLQHLKQRGKGPGQILQVTEQLLNFKFMPSYLRMTFDFQDDAEDRERADINKVRADTRIQNVAAGIMNDRAMREKMFEEGEINRQQFEQMEVEDGRLENGDNILTLFYSAKFPMRKFLDLGVEDPLDVKSNDINSILDAISDKRRGAMEEVSNAKNEENRWNATKATQALNFLESLYLGKIDANLEETFPMQIGQPGQPGQPGKPGKQYVDPRVRTNNPANPTSSDTNPERTLNDSAKTPPEDTPQ